MNDALTGMIISIALLPIIHLITKLQDDAKNSYNQITKRKFKRRRI